MAERVERAAGEGASAQENAAMAKLIKLYESGATMKSLAEKHGTTTWNIRKLLLKHGASLRSSRARMARIDSAFYRDRDAGMSYKELAAKHGMSINTVRRRLEGRG